MKHVLLALNWYEQPVHEGVVAYASEHGWQLNNDLVRRTGRLRTEWAGDGIIANFGGNRAFTEMIRSFDCPVVTVNTSIDNPDDPSVSADMEKAVSIAFDYFRRKGFQYFGCYGSKYSGPLATFRNTVETNDFPCAVLLWEPSDLDQELVRIREWLSASPLPMAVYCPNDDVASLLVNLAIEAGFDVPHDVAILGSENWELACTSARVHLSSIDLNLFDIGYRAAETLDQIMDGGPQPPLQTLIDPKGIVERASTDTIGAASPYVRQAIAIMERDYEKGISVNDVVADVGISHSSLEKAFRTDLGYPPVVALRNVRMKAATLLLASTDEKVQTISDLVGMNNKEYFQTLFKRHFGITPRKYRLQEKAGE